MKFWEYNGASDLEVQVAQALIQARDKLRSYRLARLPNATGLWVKRAEARRWLLVLALALPFSMFSAAAPAQQQQSYNYSKQGGISVEQAAAMVRRETGGRVLSANPVKSNGQRGYNIRVLIDGKRVKQYYVDDQGRMSPD